MNTITSSIALKEAIQKLEVEQAIKGQALKQQFRLTYESLKPANLLLGAFHDITESPDVLKNVFGTGAGLISGFISKKIFVGTSGNLFRKLVGSLMQFGVSNFVANHPEAIKTIGQFIFQQFLRFKDRNKAEEEE